MTVTLLVRPTSVSTESPSIPLALLGLAAVTVLAGRPEWGLVPVGAMLFWGVREAGSPSASRRLLGHGTTLVAVAFALAVSMPVFLPPVLDQLLLSGMLAAALAVVVASAPSVRAALRPRRPELADLAWLVAALGAMLVVVAVVPPAVGPARDVELAAFLALVLVVPVLSELVFRGLLMHDPDTAARRVVPVALAQGLLAAAFFGWAGLVIGSQLGIALGVARLYGGWQASLYAHWGLALGVAAPLLMVAR